jgi:cysteinyl-tRNA synthetase
VPGSVLAALEDDLNTPLALSELLGVARSLNTSRDDAERRRLARSLRAGGALLGLLEADPQAWFERPAGTSAGDLDATEIDSLLAQRDAFRRDRNYREADRIRDRLAERGVVIEDKPEGARWRRVAAASVGVSPAAAGVRAGSSRDEGKR